MDILGVRCKIECGESRTGTDLHGLMHFVKVGKAKQQFAHLPDAGGGDAEFFLHFADRAFLGRLAGIYAPAGPVDFFPRRGRVSCG